MSKYVSKNSAFRSCIQRAGKCSADEAVRYYRLAVMLDPVSEEGYLGLISCLKNGGCTPESDGSCLLKDAFSAAEYNRSLKNIESLRSNEEGYERVIAAVNSCGEAIGGSVLA